MELPIFSSCFLPLLYNSMVFSTLKKSLLGYLQSKAHRCNLLVSSPKGLSGLAVMVHWPRNWSLRMLESHTCTRMPASGLNLPTHHISCYIQWRLETVTCRAPGRSPRPPCPRGWSPVRSCTSRPRT